jgi:hypothetical protein
VEAEHTNHLGKDGSALLSAYSCDYPVLEKFHQFAAATKNKPVSIQTGLQPRISLKYAALER